MTQEKRTWSLLGLASGIAVSLLVLFLSSSTSVREEIPDNLAKRRLEKEDHVQFVFIIGLEGTGHHLLADLVEESPAVAQIKNMGLEGPTQRLQSLLHPNGLFDGVCDLTQETDVKLEKMKFIAQLERVKHKLGGPNPQTVFFNAQHEELSYPLGGGECRQLHYPDLDDLYDACDQAGATCGHVYMHRDPYEVLRSAQRRQLNPTVLSAIKTEYSMLNIIYAQLAAHSERTLGCWGFFDGEAAESSLWNSVQELLLWQDKNEFQDTVRRVVHGRTPPMSEAERADLVPQQLAPAMKSMIKAHERTLKLCQTHAHRNATGTVT